MSSCLTVSFLNQSRGATSYLWDFGDGVTSATANPQHTYVQAGAYVVTLTSTGPAGTAVARHTIITVGNTVGAFLLDASGDNLATAAGDFLLVPTVVAGG